jgi:hypothetical protein
MFRLALAMACLFPCAALAQAPSCPAGQAGCPMAHGGQMHQMMHGQMTPGQMTPGQTMPGHMMPGHMMPGHMMPGMAGPAAASALPTQPGQGAFAAIQEIVAILETDPATDWSKVNIEALRQHLIDMNSVTLQAQVENEPIADGMVFVVTGTGPVTGSIRRMVSAHAATMNGAGGWHFDSADVEGGARLTVHVPPADVAKLKGLGFLGVMTRGMHHQMHHLMLARGMNPHE